MGVASRKKYIYRPHTDGKLQPTDCSKLLKKYRSGQIQQTNQASLAYPIDKSFVTRSNTDHSFQISVHAQKIDQMRHDIFNQGVYYEDIMSDVIADMFSKANNHSPKVMLDIGANVGWFSLLAASHGAEVFAFEPNVINVVRFCESQLLNGWSLAENFESNNRIHTYLNGVGSEHGKTLIMYTPDPNNPGSHTFNKDLAEEHFLRRKSDGDLQKLDGGKLPIITLDALAQDQGWLSNQNEVKITLMKMDIEGLEPVALAGSKKLLRAKIIENVLMEFNGDLPNSDWISLVKTLFDCGYKLYKIGDHRGPNLTFQKTSEDPESVVDNIKKSLPSQVVNES
jgi:FkbM family methyltransferase